jgi:hypothetical protein
MQCHLPILFENIPGETLRCEKLFLCKNIQVTAKQDLVNHFAIVTIGVLSNGHLFTKRSF